MIGPLLDDVKFKVDSTLRSIVFGAMVAAALGAASICGAVVLFLWVSQNYGVMEAWTALGGLFFAMAIVGLIALAASRGRVRRRMKVDRAAAAEHSAKTPNFMQDPSSLLKDPAMLLTGLQIVRMIGIRRLLPLLLVGGVAAGFLLTRNEEPDHPAPAE